MDDKVSREELRRRLRNKLRRQRETRTNAMPEANATDVSDALTRLEQVVERAVSDDEEAPPPPS